MCCMFHQIAAGGRILLGSQLIMNAKQKTFAVALSRQMAPSAHILAYCIKNGEVITDAITFFIRDTRLRTVRLHLNVLCSRLQKNLIWS